MLALTSHPDSLVNRPRVRLERNARFFSLNVGFTTTCVGVSALTLMHSPLSFSLTQDYE